MLPWTPFPKKAPLKQTLPPLPMKRSGSDGQLSAHLQSRGHARKNNNLFYMNKIQKPAEKRNDDTRLGLIIETAHAYPPALPRP
jgi:hypothetical protein